MKLNLNQITIQVNDLERSITFYQKLGLKLIVHSPPKYARFECLAGDSTFSLHHQEQLHTNNPTWLYFESENLDETVKELQACGIRFDELPTDQPWLWTEARLKDPDGNTIILYHAGDKRKNPPWRI